MLLPWQGFVPELVNDVPIWAPAVHVQLAVVPVIWHETEPPPQLPVHALVAFPLGAVVELVHSAPGLHARYASTRVLQLGSATTTPDVLHVY